MFYGYSCTNDTVFTNYGCVQVGNPPYLAPGNLPLVFSTGNLPLVPYYGDKCLIQAYDGEPVQVQFVLNANGYDRLYISGVDIDGFYKEFEISEIQDESNPRLLNVTLIDEVQPGTMLETKVYAALIKTVNENDVYSAECEFLVVGNLLHDGDETATCVESKYFRPVAKHWHSDSVNDFGQSVIWVDEPYVDYDDMNMYCDEYGIFADISLIPYNVE